MPRDGEALVLPGEGAFAAWLLAREATRRRAQYPAARKAAYKAAPHLDPLAARMLHWMEQPRCSPNIRCEVEAKYSTTALWLGTAIVHPWLMLDAWDARTVILLDIDHANARERAEFLAAHYGLPMPTIVADPCTGRAHVFWLLLTPVLTNHYSPHRAGEAATATRDKPRALFEAAGQMLARAMGGSLMPARALAKSPWGLATRLAGPLMHRDGEPATPAVWDAHRVSGSPLCWVTTMGDLAGVELTQITRALAPDYGGETKFPTAELPRPRLPRKEKRGPRAQANGDPELGRTMTIFDEVRLWAYAGRVTDEGRIHTKVAEVNRSLPDPIADRRAAGVARSIGRFMRGKFGKGRYGGKAMDLDPAKQAERGRRARAAVAAGNAEICARAVEKLTISGIKPTQRAVAKATGLSKRTVGRHWYNHPVSTQA